VIVAEGLAINPMPAGTSKRPKATFCTVSNENRDGESNVIETVDFRAYSATALPLQWGPAISLF